MRFWVCTSDANPCPPESQVWATIAEILDPAALGITPESIFKAYSWGFGAVLMAFLIGFVLSVALGLIRKT